LTVLSADELIGRAREISRTVLRENAAAVDAEDSFPARSIDAVRDAGLLPLTAPKSYGGHGASLPVVCRVADELAAGCVSTSLIMAMHWISLQYLGDWCREVDDPNEATLLEGLRELVFSDVAAGGALVASCYGEPGSGANIFTPFTQAEPTADGWRITGRKFGTLAEAASYLALHTVVTSGEHARSVVQFIVPAKTRGITVKRISGLIGVRGAAPCAVEFDGCIVGERFRFLPPGYFAPTNDTYPYATLLLSSPYLGAARAAVEAARTFARDRILQGSGIPLATRADVQSALAGLVIDLEAASSLLYRAAAEAVPDPGASVRILVEAAKVAVTGMSTRVCTGALQMSGARNLVRPSPLERLVRDSVAGPLHPPTTAQSLATIGSLLLGPAGTPVEGDRLEPPAPWWWTSSGGAGRA
jgi:alkylation response protein AidB-like acyl-CoA dehydrogenase